MKIVAAHREAMALFVKEAVDSERAIDEGDAVFLADDVHAWLDRVARGEKVRDPEPWRR